MGGFYFHHLLAGCGPQPGQEVEQTGGWHGPGTGLCPQNARSSGGGGALISWEQGVGTGKMFPGLPLTPVPSAAASAPRRRRERKRGEKKQSVSIQAVLPPSESRGVLTFLLPAA